MKNHAPAPPPPSRTTRAPAMMNSYYFDILTGTASSASDDSTGTAGAAIVAFLYMCNGGQMFVIKKRNMRLRFGKMRGKRDAYRVMSRLSCQAKVSTRPRPD